MRARTRTRAVAAGAGAALAFGLLAPMAVATPYDFHELEGNIYDDSVDDPPYDWSDIFEGDPQNPVVEPAAVNPLPGGIIDADFTRDFRVDSAGDYQNGDTSYYATGSKDTLDITPGWQCKRTNNATDKGDWINAYGYAVRVDHDDNINTPEHTLFYFGLEKDDDNGTNNVGIWLLQDGTVGCEASGGGNFDWTGSHVNGDLLGVVAYDSGGNVGTAQGFVWNDGLPGTPTFEATDAKCDANASGYQVFCIIPNGSGPIESPWWSPQKGDKSSTAELQTNVFVEGYLDVTEIFKDTPDGEPCFASAVANSRASTSTTAALYDFVQIEAQTCGPMTVKKYFDENGNGTHDQGEPYLAGWDVDVFADGESAGNGDSALYSGTTADGTEGSTLGAVRFADVPTGEYDVYETMQTGYYNTDPGPDDGSGFKHVTQTPAGSTVEFGNACYVDKTFQVTGVPSGTALTVTYTILGDVLDPSDDVVGTLDLTESGGTASGTLNDVLKPTDHIAWSYAYTSGTPTGSVTVTSDEAMYPYTHNDNGTSCTKTNTTAFPTVTLSGMKYKDVDGVETDGTPDEGDAGLQGFQFTLFTGTAGDSGTQVGSPVNSDGTGAFSFTGVVPGDYSIVETGQTGWTKTYPASFSTVSVSLGASSPISIGNFFNAPLTDIYVEVDPQTDYTYADSIQCVKGSDPVGTDVDGTSADGGVTKSVDADDLLVGTYVCTIVITDP